MIIPCLTPNMDCYVAAAIRAAMSCNMSVCGATWFVFSTLASAAYFRQTRLSKILAIKKECIDELKEMNTQVEKLVCGRTFLRLVLADWTKRTRRSAP